MCNSNKFSRHTASYRNEVSQTARKFVSSTPRTHKSVRNLETRVTKLTGKHGPISHSVTQVDEETLRPISDTIHIFKHGSHTRQEPRLTVQYTKVTNESPHRVT